MTVSQTLVSIAVVAAIMAGLYILARRARSAAGGGAGLRLVPVVVVVVLVAAVAVAFMGLQQREAAAPPPPAEENSSERASPPPVARPAPVDAASKRQPPPDDGAEGGEIAPRMDDSEPEGPVTAPEPQPSGSAQPSRPPAQPSMPAAPETTRPLDDMARGRRLEPPADMQPRSLEPAERRAPGLGGQPAAADRTAAEPPESKPESTPAIVTDEEEGSGFSVVPVFFGTDRKQMLGAKRLTYGSDRGRRLELGRALVSVPTSHEVPQIERPWEVRIPYFDVVVYQETEDPAKHFTLREIKTMSRPELLALVAERLGKSRLYKDHALLFVHGFNTSFDNAVYRTAQIAHDLKFDGAPFLYSWPSGGAVASYTYDRESAGQSEPFLRQFLEMIVKDSGAKSVSVVAHSMGNQPVLQVLKDLKALQPAIEINQIVLAAPDVDRDNFENLAREIKGLAKGVTLYAAANDRALSVSRRFHGGVPRAGDVPASGPVVAEGVDTIDVTAVSTDSLGLNHSGYAESNVLLEDIRLLLQTGQRPPEKRVPVLARIKTALGDYWRYPSR